LTIRFHDLDLTFVFLAAKEVSSSSALLSDHVAQSIHTIIANTSEPSTTALQAHVSDLEQELKNQDFRLQFLYNQRVSISQLLATAKNQLDKMK
jgi:hypothetical protein